MVFFNKPVLNIDEKIKLLKERDLIFEDEEKEKHYLQHIWYFRLTWYFKFFQDKENNIFKEWTTFKKVLDLYIFDRKLRLLTLDAIEKIEISLKANINDYMTENFWVFWYLEEELFFLESNKEKEIYENFIEKVNNIQNKSSSIFIKEYFKKYDEKYLPSWMLFEELTIWELSNVYRIIKTDFRQKIANNFWVYQLDFKIWIHLLTNIRNISAHHSRLWNKEYIVKPRKKDKILWNKYLTSYNKDNIEVVISNFFNATLIINYLLKIINKNFNWLDDLEKLFEEFPEIPKEKMWFTDNWKEKILK